MDNASANQDINNGATNAYYVRLMVVHNAIRKINASNAQLSINSYKTQLMEHANANNTLS